MKVRLSATLLFFSFLSFVNSDSFKGPYSYMNYEELYKFVRKLENRYPHLLRIESVHEKYNIPHQAGRCGPSPNDKCEILMLTISDFTYPRDEKTQVFLSGELHGDERVGPHVCAYLTEFLLMQYGLSERATDILRRREIVITPISNAQGFYRNMRTERSYEGIEVDINRDFPYNQVNGACLNSITARALIRIFAENLFVSAITFHGGEHSITYPWGGENHYKNGHRIDCPDKSSFSTLASVLQAQANGPSFIE